MNIENLYLSFGTQKIFEDASCFFNTTDKVGIIGVNGAGKSTLFNLILGKLSPDSGTITLPKFSKIGFLPQVITEDLENSDITVFEYLLKGRPIEELQNKLTSLYEQISKENDDKKLKYLMKDITSTEEELEYYDQYSAESILLKIISGMNIDDNLLDLKLSSISGGQKSKVAFAKLLYSKPNILLLDEPTNHLDIDTKDYIENYIKSFNGLVLIISHDTDFLNRVTNKTLYVDKLKHIFTLYNGNYDKYIMIKNQRDLARQRLFEKQQKEEEKLKRIISKYIAGNEKKANIAKDRIKKLERLEKEKVELEKKYKTSRFEMTFDHQSYSIPINIENLTFGYEENNLLYENLNVSLNRGEKLLVVGENGIGKTTLLRLIMGILKPLEGSITITEKTDIAYYAQEHEILDLSKNIMDNFANYGMADYEIRRYLGNFLFSNDDVYKEVKVLSPGERSRVSLAKIALSHANTLLLDEPTNHLDPATQLIISDTFKTFKGTILVVSHNLEFVKNLGINRMLLLPSGRITDFDEDIVLHYEMINEES